MITSLYVHIPFCAEICSYCDFPRVKHSGESIEDYIEKLENNLYVYKNKLEVKTIYIGGGTPSLLTNEQIKKLFMMLNAYMDFDKVEEITFEMNPNDVTDEKIELLSAIGVNRISLGVQTFNDRLLKNISRTHDSASILTAVKTIRKSINNLSFDLIYNLPGQTIVDIKNDINQIRILSPEHISWYSLIIKDGSKLAGHVIDVDKEEEFMDLINVELKKSMYNQYEISNFSVSKKFESQHNKAYWNSDNWLGIGFGAASHMDGTIIENLGSPLEWDSKIKTSTKSEWMYQVIIMGLRYKEGMDLTQKLQKDAYNEFKDSIDCEIKKGTLILEGNKLRASDGYYMLLDSILVNIE